MSCIQENNNQNKIQSISAEDAIKLKQQWEDQVDYQFVQRIIQELTQSCALPLPVPAAAIPPLILQAAQYFWENYDGAVEERYYCIKNSDFNKCGANITFKLPERIDIKNKMTISTEFKLSEATGDRIVSGIKTLMAIKLARP